MLGRGFTSKPRARPICGSGVSREATAKSEAVKPTPPQPSPSLREMEIPLFVEVLNHCEGNQSRAAALLGIHRATLRKKLKEYGLA